MKFRYTNLGTCETATGLTVVIDVIRAFTTAAFAFSRGAREIYPVSGVEEALQLRARMPDSLVCGEVGGSPPEGFDFGNSPAQTNLLDLAGRVIVQRTSAGTQGIARSVNARAMLAASFVVAQATAKYILNFREDSITFVITGQTEDGRGDEDLACAEYLQALLMGSQPDPAPYLDRVCRSWDALMQFDRNFADFPESDLDYCARIDAFDFAMPVSREPGRHVMRAVKTT